MLFKLLSFAAVGVVSPAWAQVPPPAGHYKGQWTNNTFSSTGPILADVVVAGTNVSLTVDVGGSVFGVGDPPPFTVAGQVAAGAFNAAVTNHPTLGNVTVNITAGGVVTVTGTNVPGGVITGFSATGTLTPAGALNLNGTINFAIGPAANTTIAVTRTVFSTLASPGPSEQAQFGFVVAGTTDLTGDNRGDLLIGSPLEAHGATTFAGRAFLVNGVGNGVARTFVSPAPESTGRFGGAIASVPDVNNDGKPDIVIGAAGEDPGTSPFDCGRAYIYSGATGGLLWKLLPPAPEVGGYFGYSVAGVPDVNGDGRGDVIVGALRENPGGAPADAGRVHIYSGANGARIRTLAAPGVALASDYFGFSVAGLPDVNGDGRGDILVGMPQGTGVPTGRPGKAFIFSGANGALLRTFNSPGAEADGGFGRAVAAVPDTNADGRFDVVVGAPFEDPGANPDSTGRAYLFSGGTGALLFKLVPPTPTLNGRFGLAVGGMGDTDGDNKGDVLVGAFGEGSAGQGRAYIYSGATGLRLVTIASPYAEASGGFGGSVAGVPTVNGGTRADALIGGPGEDPGTSPLNSGRAYLYRR